MLDGREIAARSVALEPTRTGLYFLLAGSEIVYVGQSIDVDSRVRQHRRGHMQFNRWTYMACPAIELDGMERAYIDAFMPRYNEDPVTKNRRIAAITTPPEDYELGPAMFSGEEWQADP